MVISLEDLLTQIARDGLRAQSSVKLASAEFFESLFEKTENGSCEPSTFAIKLLEHDVLLPIVNMMHQDQMLMKELDLELETDVSLSTNEKGELLVDCTLKKSLLKKNTMLKIKLKLESKESTEGIEQTRAHLADKFSDDLQIAKIERKEKDKDNG